MARTWVRAWKRVRLGHVIRYIGLGKGGGEDASTAQADAIHRPNALI